MSKPLRITLIVTVILLVVLLVGFFYSWYAVKQKPDWYVQEVAKSTTQNNQKEAGQAVEQELARVVSGFEKSGEWEALFNEEQVNRYLAATLVEKHPNLLPSELKNPRVKIESDGLTIAAQLEKPIKTVVTIKFDVFLPRPNTIALRIRHIRAGNLPWSQGRLTKEISKIAQKNRVPIHWTQMEQDSVAMLTIVPSSKSKSTEITACQLEDGKLYVAGVTKPSKKKP